MDAILRWVALWLAKILEKFGDPQLQAKLDAFNTKVADAEKREREAAEAARASDVAYQVSLNRRRELDQLIEASVAEENASEQRLGESQARVKQIEDENAAAKKKLDDLSGPDRVRVDL